MSTGRSFETYGAAWLSLKALVAYNSLHPLQRARRTQRARSMQCCMMIRFSHAPDVWSVTSCARLHLIRSHLARCLRLLTAPASNLSRAYSQAAGKDASLIGPLYRHACPAKIQVLLVINQYGSTTLRILCLTI